MKGGVAAALLILGGVVWLIFHLGSGGTRRGAPPPGGVPLPRIERVMALTTSEQCKSCHPGVYEEWYESHHRISYTNPMVQTQSKGFTDRDCLPCHLPRPVYDSGLGYRVLEREVRYDDGVDCFTCHLFSEGNTCIGGGPLGPGAEAAPCNPTTHVSIRDMSVCAPCHNQHKVHDDWSETRFAIEGEQFKDCNDCHMPVVERANGKQGRSHRFRGAHDAEMIRSGVSVTIEKVEPGRQLLIEVRNDGTGHNFPADERHRAVDLHLEVETARGSSDVRVDRYRNPYRTEFHIKNPLREPGAERDYELGLGLAGKVQVHAKRVPPAFQGSRRVPYPESTQIPAGEARSYRLQLPESVRSAHLRLWFRKNPFQPDHEAVLIHEKSIVF